MKRHTLNVSAHDTGQDVQSPTTEMSRLLRRPPGKKERLPIGKRRDSRSVPRCPFIGPTFQMWLPPGPFPEKHATMDGMRLGPFMRPLRFALPPQPPGLAKRRCVV